MPHHHASQTDHPNRGAPTRVARLSLLGWSAWARVAAVVPVLVILWLAVWWASAEAAPW